MKAQRLLSAIFALVLLAAACSEPLEEESSGSTEAPTEETDAPADSEPPADTTAPETDDTAEPEPAEDDAEPTDDGSVVFQSAGQDWTFGEVPANATPADDSLEPVKLGMINQENTPLGSFPEMRGAAQAAVAFINAELGGVGGRPIELSTCITSFSVEQSQACAQEMVNEDVVAIAGGIDVTSNGSIPILEQNGIPIFGGIPANLVEQQSSINFFLSGGGAGGAAAFMAHAAENGAETVVLAYGEFESFEIAARDYAGEVGKSLGMNVELVSFPIIGADFLPVLTTADQVDADALIVLAADTACIPLMEGKAQLELKATLYLTGGCAADTIVEAAGDNISGVVFNSEGPIDPDDPEGAIYAAVVDKYAVDPAGGAGTVGFRSVMNLYSILLELGPDNVTSEGIIELASSAVDRRSFWGHPYTCDGQRVPGFPALCAPEQVLFSIEPGELPIAVSDWIQTDDLFQEALGG